MKLGDSAVEEVEAIPSGSLGIDLDPWCKRVSKRKNHRNLRTRIVR